MPPATSGVPKYSQGWHSHGEVHTIVSSLADRQCIPCRGDVPPLTREQLRPLLEQIDTSWQLQDVPSARHGSVTMLHRDYRFRDFKDAMAFAVRVGDLAEEQRHHPDLHVAWGKVGVDIWTHKIGGLTESDVVFAAKCDALYEKHAPRSSTT